VTPSDHLRGTAGAPLVATRAYDFHRAITPEGRHILSIPYSQRGSWDDHGVVTHPEQDVFLAHLLAPLGITHGNAYPGEWPLPDLAALDAAWAALTAALRDPAPTVPVAHAQRSVSRADAPAVSAALTARTLDLVSHVLGLTGDPFICTADDMDSSDYQTTRTVRWRRGECHVHLDAIAIESGYGIHGERSSHTIASPPADGRDVAVHTTLDMRSGGSVSVTVRGVLDAQALADRFITFTTP
jgi:hypothetical protein